MRTEDKSLFALQGLRFGKASGSLSAVPAVPIPVVGGIGDQEPRFLAPTVTISASPSSIDWGQSATLTWSSTNAVSATITPDIGAVPASGSRRVSPTATTTYRITVWGADGETQTATASTEVTVMISERALLRALYEATGGPNWTQNENWLTDRPLGEWYGVQVDGGGRVTSLYLSDNNLAGSIPAELGLLTSLQDLSLFKNGLTGPIPAELGSLTNLQDLGLSKNGLTGPIPVELASLTSLEELVLFENSLTGPIPAELGSLTRLRSLDLSGNGLTGLIPVELGGLTNLRELDLSGNNLTGSIPVELGSLANLRQLSLSNNNLRGPIPAKLGSLANLELLSLSVNDLAGVIPAKLGSLTNLRQLFLYDTNLRGGIPAELGSLVNLIYIDLALNNLTGPIPAELGALTKLQALILSDNELTGPIPSTFLGISLKAFVFDSNAGLCLPGGTDFITWSKGIADFRGGGFCNDSDRAVLEALYQLLGGPGWTNSGGWRDDDVLGEWYGVSVDSLGRVTALDLSGNGLEGRLTSHLGELSRMTELRVDGNDLSGRLPMSLVALPSFRVLRYADTELCAPVETRFQEWLNGLTSHDGTGVECAPLSDRDALVALYDSTDGPNWARNENWLTDRPLDEWTEVRVDNHGRVIDLTLPFNGLTGSIPAELGSLANLNNLLLAFNNLRGPIPKELGLLTKLRYFQLSVNNLTGPIPEELGSLVNLEQLSISDNNLTGPIPAELGSLTTLRALNLDGNNLTGSIPGQLGLLSNLEFLHLSNNSLTGPIPPELGSLVNLEQLSIADNNLTGSIPMGLRWLSGLEALWLHGNDLTGSIPEELGGLMSLREMFLSRNPRLSGALPASLTNLHRLEVLMTGDTGLCAPSEARFLDWLEGVWKQRVSKCGTGNPPPAYLTQAVQSREFPVPLVAGKQALLRVFVTAPNPTDEHLPPVRATFYLHGKKTYVADIPGKPVRIPNDVTEWGLDTSANIEIPGWVVRPGLEMVIDVDPQDRLSSTLGVTKRIPDSGRLRVEIRAMPVLNLTVIPFRWSQAPDKSVLQLVQGMSQDPEGHPLLWHTRTLLPVGELDVTDHASVLTSTNDIFELLSETEMIRIMEGASGHYLGMVAGEILVGPVAGVAIFSGRSTVSTPEAPFIAHEIGHNWGLLHARCGVNYSLDPFFSPGRRIHRRLGVRLPLGWLPCVARSTRSDVLL